MRLSMELASSIASWHEPPSERLLKYEFMAVVRLRWDGRTHTEDDIWPVAELASALDEWASSLRPPPVFEFRTIESDDVPMWFSRSDDGWFVQTWSLDAAIGPFPLADLRRAAQEFCDAVRQEVWDSFGFRLTLPGDA